MKTNLIIMNLVLNVSALKFNIICCKGHNKVISLKFLFFVLESFRASVLPSFDQCCSYVNN